MCEAGQTRRRACKLVNEVAKPNYTRAPGEHERGSSVPRRACACVLLLRHRTGREGAMAGESGAREWAAGQVHMSELHAV